MEHLFSILIPAYKSKYLKECIHSILAQTYSNYEIIIVDDASPEDLKTIVNGFVDGRVHYYRNEKNYGPSMWLTIGINVWIMQQVIMLSVWAMMICLCPNA